MAILVRALVLMAMAMAMNTAAMAQGAPTVIAPLKVVTEAVDGSLRTTCLVYFDGSATITTELKGASPTQTIQQVNWGWPMMSSAEFVTAVAALEGETVTSGMMGDSGTVNNQYIDVQNTAKTPTRIYKQEDGWMYDYNGSSDAAYDLREFAFNVCGRAE